MIENWYLHIILAYAVSLIPIAGKYFAALNTMIHEDGHAFCSKIFGGQVRHIGLFPNTEGVAVTASRYWIGKVVTSYAGYTFSSIVAYLCFFLIDADKTNYLLYGFIALAIFNLIFWVRNTYGILWLISFIALCGYLLYDGNSTLQIFVTFFLSAIILTQSVSTSFTILTLSFKQPRDAGDASSLARHTKIIPAPIWGLIFFGQSVYIAYVVLKDFVIQ